MRIIKFRAWDSYQKKMIEWNDLCNPKKLTLSNLLNGFIDNITPMQFTGLKDKNGVEIYEGDVIQINHPYKQRSFIGVVKYGKYSFYCKDFWFTHFDNPTDIFSEGTEYIEIIRNIHQNKKKL